MDFSDALWVPPAVEDRMRIAMELEMRAAIVWRSIVHILDALLYDVMGMGRLLTLCTAGW